MIFGKTKLELKVGVFVFIGFVVLVFFVLSIGKVKNWYAGYRVNFVYTFVNGVKLGAPVRFAGMDVGEVKEIKFLFDPVEVKTKLKVNCWVKRDIKIPLDSTVWVNTLGLLGEKYIEIMPGKDYGKCMQENSEMRGVDPLPMHEIVRLADNIADNVNESIIKIKNGEGTIGKLLYDDTIYNDLEALVADLRSNPWKLFWKSKEKPPAKKNK